MITWKAIYLPDPRQETKLVEKAGEALIGFFEAESIILAVSEAAEAAPREHWIAAIRVCKPGEFEDEFARGGETT